MGLFDIFSNDVANKAASQANAGAQAGYNALAGAYGTGRDAITSNYDAGRSAIGSNYGAGRDALTSGYGAAGNLWNGLAQQYGAGAQAYGDATGANGANGYTRAQQNFQTDPGYQFQLNQGLQALDRTHAAAGNLSSGNADTDTLKYATGLADQSYGNYVSRLAPYLNANLYATSGAAGIDTGLAGGLNSSYQGQGNQTNAAYQGQGNLFNSSLQNQGNAASSTFNTIGNNTAGAELNNYKTSANDINGLLSAGKLAANLFGSFAAPAGAP